MKLFKKLAGACLALTLCFGAFGLVACGEKEDNGFTPQENAYNFQVLNAEGEGVEGYKVLICLTGGACSPLMATDADGYVAISGVNLPVANTAGEYEIHVMAPTPAGYLDYEGAEMTPAAFSTEIITLTLTA